MTDNCGIDATLNLIQS